MEPSSRKREGKGRSAERESKRPRVEADSGPVHSDNEGSLGIEDLGREFDSHYEGDVSPFGTLDTTEYFPLEKGDLEGVVSKKSRKYRGASDREKPRYSSQERERKDHKKHRSERQRRVRQHRSPSPVSSGSGHKSRGIRRNVSSGHNSPHMYEGRRSHEYQGRERNSAHSYKPEREREEAGYRRGDHMQHHKEHYEGRRGSGAGVQPTSLHGPRSRREHQGGRSRSPYDDIRRRGRDERELSGGGNRRGWEGGYAHQKPHARRERHIVVESQYVESSSEGSSAEEPESRPPKRLFTLRHEHIQSLLEGQGDVGGREGDSRSTTDSSDETGSDQGEEGELRGGGEEGGGGGGSGAGARKRRSSSGSSASGDSSHEQSASHSWSARSRSPQSPQSEDKLSLPFGIRSKFDSDADDSGEDARPPSRPPHVSGPSEEGEGEGKEKQQRADQEEASKEKEEEATEKLRYSQFLAELGSDKEGEEEEEEGVELSTLPCYLPGLMGCRNVESYEWLNRIEEGTYGVVHRAKDKKTGEIVALKKLKMEKEKEGFPITSLREINMLLKAKHPNVVHVREIVVGSNMDKIFIVMEYVEHDLKALMETMPHPFLQGEVKTLLIQLLRAVHHLHDNWILHRDLKASNLLLSHKGILKVGDFGLAREYGSPLKNYTPVVVTLWYRAPELLLGTKEYSTAVDMWSVGCIFAEFLHKEPLFRGKSEIDQINLIFKELGTPNERIWPGYGKLPTVEKVTFTNYPYNNLRKKFPPTFLTENGFNLMNRFLTYDPKKRISALEALDHKYFTEPPAPVPPSMFPTWPAKSEMSRHKRREKSPKPPEGGVNTFLGEDEKPASAFILKA